MDGSKINWWMKDEWINKMMSGMKNEMKDEMKREMKGEMKWNEVTEIKSNQMITEMKW